MDKKYASGTAKVKKKPTKITSLVTQIYRVRVLNASGEKIMYHETLSGLDHNDNELEFDHLAGRWERPYLSQAIRRRNRRCYLSRN